MAPETTAFSTSESSSLAVPKLRDDGSNWSDYHPRLQNAMGAKGLWRHVEGTAIAPVPFVVTEGKPMLADGKTPACTTYTHVNHFDTPRNEDKKFVDGRGYVEGGQGRRHLEKYSAPANGTAAAFPANASTSRQSHSYRPSLQTITANEMAGKLSGIRTAALNADGLMAFIIEEAQHRVINEERDKASESALAARLKSSGKSKGKGKRKEKGQSDVTCENCEKAGHSKADCYSKGGGKEGQAPWQKKKGKAKEPETAVIAVEDDENDMFAFTCTSDYAAVASTLDVPKSRLGTCIDSGATRDFCPDRTKFTNYKAIRREINTAEGKSLTAVGMGDLHLDQIWPLPSYPSAGWTKPAIPLRSKRECVQ